MRFRLRHLFIGCGVTTEVFFAYFFFLVYTQHQALAELKQTTEYLSSKLQQGSQQASSQQLACSGACIDAIQSATASLSLKTSTKAQTSTVAKTTSGVKEYYIPFGTGFTQNNKWEDVSGTDTMIDPANYGTIVSVIFEAGMRIPVANGTMYARLYNKTDDHPVWLTEVSTSAGVSTMVKSQPITLDAGNKLYRVQISTSLQYPSYLDFARLHITVK